MRPPEPVLIYNLFPLIAGRFDQWAPHMERASRMGFNWVFVNPVQYPGLSGSLYSIKDYASYNPRFIDADSPLAPEEQLRAAVKGASDLGLRLMIDLVINHAAVDTELIKTHPEWFLRDGSGAIIHPSADENGKRVVWGDLAKFDHHSRDYDGLFKYFMSIINRLIEIGFTGFRCDAAYQVPRELWRRLIEETRAAHPDVMFFAETLGCSPEQTRETAHAGFDYVFNSAKWWDFRSSWLIEQYNLIRETVGSVSFPESHDTIRLCEELNCNPAGLRQRYFFSALFSSGVMMPLGFEYGFRKRPHVVNSRPADWERTDIDLTAYIKSVNTLKSNNRIFMHEAPTEIFDAENHAVMLMRKVDESTGVKALVILNKDIYNSQRFRAENLRDLVKTASPLVDISPLNPMGPVTERVKLDLAPGEGRVLVTVK